MKKIVLSLLALAATMNIMAVTYSAKATITLESKSNYESCQIIIGESDELVAGLNNGEYAEINMDGRSVALYVEYDGVKYQHFASNPATMKNLTLKAKTNAAENYNLIISDVTGSFTLKLGDAEPVAIAAGTQVIALNKNDEYAIGVINYEEPAPDYGSYQRNVTNGNYGTICLPKNGVITGAALFEVAYRDANTIYCDEILSGELVAGRPYIFQASADQIVVNYSDAEAAIAVSDQGFNGLHGFYNLDDEDAYKAIDADVNNCVLYNNQYYYVVSGHAARINNYFAYIAFNEVSTTAPNTAPGRRRIAMAVNGEQTATGIDALNAADAPVKTVIDGKIYIIRGEHMFDATGRMVK